jgi:hypothetical protein
MARKHLFFLCICFLHSAILAQEVRSVNGYGNNETNPEWGMAGGDLLDDVPVAFADGIKSLARSGEMNPREISNILFEQIGNYSDFLGLSDFAWAFGQFVDHDISFVANFPEDQWMTEGAPIVVPADDIYMTPGKIIPVMRSMTRSGTGTDIANPRRYTNEITSFIDASAVYGSNQETADWLRSFEGGRMKVSKGNKLPWNTVDGEFNSQVDLQAPEMDDAVGTSTKLFVAGDVRANENPLLLSFHQLFLREHNRLCDEYLASDPSLDPTNPLTDEFLYQKARKTVGAIFQRIVYYEWLPSLGITLDDYAGYNPNFSGAVTNVFSASAFRWGHTAINDLVLRYEADGSLSSHGHIHLKDAFFNPLESLRLPFEVYLKGMGVQIQQNVDCKLVGSVRNFLFNNNPVLGGLDLAAINIQRGRERGLPDYNSLRVYYGLDRKETFLEICADQAQALILEEVYGTVDNIDPWVGMLAEDHVHNSMFGELVYEIISNQFESLRSGDRFYYENDPEFGAADLNFIEGSTLSNLIERNSEIECFQENAFVATNHEDIPCWPYVAPTAFYMSMSPNPVLDESFLNIFSAENGDGVIRIVDVLGRTLQSKECRLEKGENHLLVDWRPITVPGSYYVILEYGDEINALKVIRN